MFLDAPGATKVLISHEEAAFLAQLSTWLIEWGYQPVPNPPQATFLKGRKPWLGIFSVARWKEFGPLIHAREESQTVPRFSVVIAPVSSQLANIPDDFLEEPFRAQELRARLGLATRVLSLEQARRSLTDRLTEARSRLHQLEGSLPICMDCKKIRDESNRWQPVERYIAARTQAAFTHGLCPTCYRKRVDELCPAGE